jgi:hypothetical protein
MKIQKLLNVVLLLAFLSSFVGGGSYNVTAQTPEPPTIDYTNLAQQPERITQVDREAAAGRSSVLGLDATSATSASMALPGAAPQYFSVPNYANSPLPNSINAVVEWNAFAQEVVQPTPMPGMPMMSEISMSAAFVYLAYVQAAVYDALVSIEGGYASYNPTLAPAAPTASREAAVAAASYNVLMHYLPSKAAMLTSKYEGWLAMLPNDAAKTAGIQAGQLAAAGIIALRTGDGLLAPSTYTVLPAGPGVWQPTMPAPPHGSLDGRIETILAN